METADTEAVRARVAPFERPRGRFGLRGSAAVLAAAAPIVALWAVYLRGSSQGVAGDARYSVSWSSSFAHPTADNVLWLSAALFLLAATLLWRARTRRLVAAAAAALLVAGGCSSWSVVNATRHASPLPGALNALPRGSSSAQVEARVGEPMAANATATPLHGGASLPCLLYAVGGGGSAPGPVTTPLRRGWWLPVAVGEWRAALCFDHGRLVDRIGV